MTSFDWFAMAFLLSLAVALLIAFFLYLRTAYRNGGWREVKISFFIAIGAIFGLNNTPTTENSDLEILKEALNPVTR